MKISIFLKNTRIVRRIEIEDLQIVNNKLFINDVDTGYTVNVLNYSEDYLTIIVNENKSFDDCIIFNDIAIEI